MLNGEARAFLVDCARRSSFQREVWVFGQFAPLLGSLPPIKSSFSRPIGFLSNMSSPVPTAPCFPERNTSARVVEGKRPFSSRRLGCLT